MTTDTTREFLPAHHTHAGEAFCTSGTSPTTAVRTGAAPATLHLVGPGQVGQAFLRQLPAHGLRLVGISDSSGTLHCRDGADPRRLAAFKQAGGALVDLQGAESLPLELALDLVDADIVVDATPSGTGAPGVVRRNLAVLGRGKRLALAAKDTLCLAADALLAPACRDRVGIHAVLGGTGTALLQDLDELRRDCHAVAIVGNASTTAVIEAIEAGASIAAGIAAAQRAGVLEPDPELDLSGTDAAVKLCAVASALWQVPGDPVAVARDHLRDLDVAVVRRRHAAGRTTRLVARATRAGRLQVRFEELQRTSPLAVPPTHVAYSYHLPHDRTRLHVGHGIGPHHTAAALLQDVCRLAGRVA